MAVRRRRAAPEGGPNATSPTQDDEADILAEVGAVRDDATGNLVVDQERIAEIGAVDAETVIKNRRMEEVANKRRAHVKGVTFSTDDLLEQYEVALKTWPANTLDISAKRTTGTPITRTITSRPKSGTDLYEALRVMHGPNEEAEYEVKFFDINGRQYRGTGRITLPDARPATPVQAQGYPPLPQGYVPAQAQPYPQQPAPQQPPPAPQAAPPPSPVAQTPAFDPGSMMSMMQQMISMIDQVRASAQPAPSPVPQVFVQPPPAPAPAPVMPPMPSPHASPAEMSAWMDQAFKLFQQVTQTVQQQHQPPPPPSPPPQQPQQQMPAGPTRRPPPGMMWVWEPEYGFVLTPSTAPERPAAGPFRGPRPAYGVGDQGGGYPGQGGGYPGHQQHQQPPPPPPAREKTPVELMREAMGTMRVFANTFQEMQSMMPGHEQPEAPVAPEPENSPVRVVDTGAGKLVFGAEDDAIRWGETIVTAIPGVVKWGTEQLDALRKAQAEKQRPPPQRLPDGYVEVGPGYQPPPGFVAVPVDQHGLPPAPEQVPPPIDSVQQPPAGRQSWVIPPIPGQGEG